MDRHAARRKRGEDTPGAGHPDRAPGGAGRGDADERAAPELHRLISLQHSAGNVAVRRLLGAGAGAGAGAGVGALAMQRRSGAWAPEISYPPPLKGLNRKLYEAKLTWVIPKLATLRMPGGVFGRPEFDRDNWTMAADPQYKRAAMLVLKAGRDPGEAVRQIVAKPQLWAVDCGMWVQVAQVYAIASSMGFARFREYARTALPGLGNRFVLRIQLSSGVRRHLQWTRSSATGPVIQVDERGSSRPEKRSMDQIVADAPVGSRVSWTAKLVVDTEYGHENAIKVGPDRYQAHGFEPRTTFTRAELERVLRRITREHEAERHARGGEYIRAANPPEVINASVFVAQVEQYQVP